MTIEEKDKIKNSEDYKKVFHDLRMNLKSCLLVALSGSHAYGTNVEGSDIDIRGIYFNSPSHLFGSVQDPEQIVYHEPIDMQIYGLNKAAWLLKACNPAMIEILGCREEDYLQISPGGRILMENLHLFLSKRAEKTFNGYAKSQLTRLMNKTGRAKDELLENEQRSLEKAFLSFTQRHRGYIDKSASAKLVNDKLYCSFSVKDMPLSEVANVYSEINSLDKDYRKSVRNDKAEKKCKISKHMMHLLRLYITGTELLRDGIIHTYREKEHDLLMSIRNGEYIKEDGKTPKEEFFEIVESYESEFQKAVESSKLPEHPDEKGIDHLLQELNVRYNPAFQYEVSKFEK